MVMCKGFRLWFGVEQTTIVSKPMPKDAEELLINYTRSVDNNHAATEIIKRLLSDEISLKKSDKFCFTM